MNKAHTMNEPLTVEQRKSVAEMCGWKPKYWNPDLRYNKYQWNRLVRVTAQFIKDRKRNAVDSFAYDLAKATESQFVTYIATNDTPEIERMAWELLENKDE